VFEHGLERLALVQRRVFGRQFLHPVKEKEKLCLERLLAADGAIVVERGDALGWQHEIRPTLFCNARDKVEDGRFGRAVVPGGTSQSCASSETVASSRSRRERRFRTHREDDRGRRDSANQFFLIT
jgi:hypothetical protein